MPSLRATVSLPELASSGRFSVLQQDPVLVRSAALRIAGFPQQAEVNRRLQQQVTLNRQGAPTPQQVRASQRRLWKREVKLWLRKHDRGSDWELPAAEERQLVSWFNALDLDGSGTVEEEEIRALLQASGARCSPSVLRKMFATVDKQPTDRVRQQTCLAHQICYPHSLRTLPPLLSHTLSRPLCAQLNLQDFIKLMHLNGGLFQPPDPSASQEDEYQPSGGGAGAQQEQRGRGLDLGAASAGTRPPMEGQALMMMNYRRLRMMTDIRDPAKRNGFRDREAFAHAYGGGHTHLHHRRHHRKRHSVAELSFHQGFGHHGGGGGSDDVTDAGSDDDARPDDHGGQAGRKMGEEPGAASEADQPSCAPTTEQQRASRWKAATAVEINTQRRSKAAPPGGAGAGGLRPESPEMIGALEIRQDAVTGAPRVMDAMEQARLSRAQRGGRAIVLAGEEEEEEEEEEEGDSGGGDGSDTRSRRKRRGGGGAGGGQVKSLLAALEQQMARKGLQLKAVQARQDEKASFKASAAGSRDSSFGPGGAKRRGGANGGGGGGAGPEAAATLGAGAIEEGEEGDDDDDAAAQLAAVRVAGERATSQKQPTRKSLAKGVYSSSSASLKLPPLAEAAPAAADASAAPASSANSRLPNWTDEGATTGAGRASRTEQAVTRRGSGKATVTVRQPMGALAEM